ncbi:MAG TPA: CPBP family intramembrane glutamic endopeptidase [Thermoanaerobaculia bacterium]|nr:CPBP family intramembrane glutamic endopeptidase [Thermoanaerobaculia bacterium]
MSAAVLRAVLAFGAIWLGLLLVPAAREIVASQMQSLPDALRRQLPIGLLSGAVLVAVDVALLQGLGAVKVEGIHRAALSLVALSLLVVAFLALTEEMVFRGVLFTRLEERAGAVTAVLATALLFSVFHFVGRPFSWSQALTYLLDGLFLAGLVWWTRDLWTAVGWHVAKNAAVGQTFGGTYRLNEPLLRIHEVAADRVPRPAALAADFLAFAVSVALCLALLWLTRRAGDV